jgi:hypothetical protein
LTAQGAAVRETYEEYRLRAAYCREMARLAWTLEMRGDWDRLSNTWLAMIPRGAGPDYDDLGETIMSPEAAGQRQRAA